MTKYKLKILIFSFFSLTLFCSSSKGQTSISHTTNKKSEEHAKLVRTLGTMNENVSCQILDNDGNLWFSIRGEGAYRFDGKSFTSFRENETFVNFGIHSILEDKKGNMWFTTDKNGVYCYDGKTFKNYTTANGLVNNAVFSILEDKDGNIWFGTRWFGLSRFDGKSFTTFSQYDNEI
jgi:ligand-binding sensor domain-containing protein